MSRSLVDNIVDLYQHDNQRPFWDKNPEPHYSELNQVEAPTEDVIKNYQLEKIRALQTAALKKSNNIEEINKLFTNGDINSLAIEGKENEKIEINKSISNVVRMINSTYSDKQGSIANNNLEYKYNNLSKHLKSLQKELQLLQKQLQIKDVVYEDNLNSLAAAIHACDMHDLSSGAIEKWYREINLYKGGIVEQIGKAWLAAKKIPNTRSINTAAVNYQGSNKNGRNKGQLIQDLMVIHYDTPDLLNSIQLEYRVAGSNQKIRVTLGEFMDLLDAQHETDKQIIIEDEAYDTLLQYSALNIQAKAGFNQTPWNKTQATKFTLNDFKHDAKLNGVGVQHIFYLLHSLNQEIPKDQWVKSEDSDYNAMANYGLATVLHKILHLSGENGGNQYLLTPQGFTTYPERIEYLMNKHKTAITISSSVKISNDTMTREYHADIPKSWNK